jgi:hypothetical protein
MPGIDVVGGPGGYHRRQSAASAGRRRDRASTSPQRWWRVSKADVGRFCGAEVDDHLIYEIIVVA